MQVPRGPLIFKHRYLQVNTAFWAHFLPFRNFFFCANHRYSSISYMGIYNSICQKNLWEQNRVHLAVCLSPKLVHSVPPKSMQASVGKGDLWRHQNCTTAPDWGTVSPQSKSEGLCQSMMTLLVSIGKPFVSTCGEPSTIAAANFKLQSPVAALEINSRI